MDLSIIFLTILSVFVLIGIMIENTLRKRGKHSKSVFVGLAVRGLIVLTNVGIIIKSIQSIINLN